MSKKSEFIFLKEEDMIEAGVLDVKKCVDAIDETFKLVGEKDYLMGGPKGADHGLKIWFPATSKFERMPVAGPDRRFMSLVGYLGGRFHITGNKWYGSNIDNREKALPRSIHTITLNDTDTGEPLAIMSGNLVSAMRTGAVPGVAAKYLASEQAKVVGLVGTGVINRASILSIYETRKQINKIKVFDINVDRAKDFKVDIASQIKEDVEIEIVHSLEDCIVDSDIINTATSGNVKPEIKDEWLKKGALLILTGGAALSDKMYTENRIVIDNFEMHEAWLRDAIEHEKGIEYISELVLTGDLLSLYHQGVIKRENITELGDVVLNKAKRKNNEERIIFVTGGMVLEDIAWAHDVYKNAIEKNIGQKLPLWESPHWS